MNATPTVASTTSTADPEPPSSGRKPRTLRKKVPTEQSPTPVRMRRSPARIGLGVALVALGGLGGAWALSAGGRTHDVLTLRAPVDAGDKIERTDLTTTKLHDSTGVDGITPQAASSVIGRYATGNLPAGTVLVPGMASADFAPLAGQSVIGIAVKPSQRPAVGLQAGQRVRLVLGASGGAGGAAQALPSGVKIGQSWPARVSAVGSPNDDQSTTVDVTVSGASATQIAAAASTGAMVIVLDPAGS